MGPRGAGQRVLGPEDPRVAAGQPPVRSAEPDDGPRQRRQQRVERHQQPRSRARVGRERHDEVGRPAQQSPPGRARRRRAVGDRDGLAQVGVQVAVPPAGVRPVVPGDGVRAVGQQPARRPGPVGELPVLTAVGAERLVEAADLVVPPAAAGDDRADEEAVPGRVGVQEVAGLGVRRAQPLRLGQLRRPVPARSAWRRRPTTSASGSASGSATMRSTKAGSGVVSASSSTRTSPVLAATPRLRTAATRKPVVVLAHHPDAVRDDRRPAGPVVGDHHLVGRAGLAAQRREGPVELRLLLVVGHHDGDRAPRRTCRGEVPAVAGHAGAERAAPSSAHRGPPRAVGGGGVLEPRTEVGPGLDPGRRRVGAARPRGAEPASSRRRG